MQEKMTKKQIFSLIAIFVAFVGLVGAAFYNDIKLIIQNRAAGTGEVPVSAAAGKTSLVAGESTEVSIMMKNTSNTVKSLQTAGVELSFDAAKFTVSGLSCGQDIPIPAVSNIGANKITLTCMRSGGSGPFVLQKNVDVKLGSFQIQVKSGAALGSSQLSFTRTIIPDATSYADISNSGTGLTFTVTTGPGATNTPGGPTLTPTKTRTPTPTITPGGPSLTPTSTSIPSRTPTPCQGQSCVTPTRTPTPTTGVGRPVTMNIMLKFQGIAGAPAGQSSMDVRVKLAGCNLAQPTDYKTGTFAVDSEGIWTGSVDFTLPSCNSGTYTVYVKGPNHIQKKVCDNTPTETAGGTYSCADGLVTLSRGTNDLDFSGILMLAGDLPAQDGSVTAYDTSLVRNNLGSTDPDALANSDVNLDGRVDTQDYSLIIAALSIKNDEQ